MLLHDLFSGKNDDHDQVIIQVGSRYRGSFNPFIEPQGSKP
jgi:hypothetical protein